MVNNIDWHRIKGTYCLPPAFVDLDDVERDERVLIRLNDAAMTGLRQSYSACSRSPIPKKPRWTWMNPSPFPDASSPVPPQAGPGMDVHSSSFSSVPASYAGLNMVPLVGRTAMSAAKLKADGGCGRRRSRRRECEERTKLDHVVSRDWIQMIMAKEEDSAKMGDDK